MRAVEPSGNPRRNVETPAAGFQPALAGIEDSRISEKPAEKGGCRQDCQARLPAPQNWRNFGRTTLATKYNGRKNPRPDASFAPGEPQDSYLRSRCPVYLPNLVAAPCQAARGPPRRNHQISSLESTR